MQINANAKINLALDVLNKRDDGYHEVSMIMQEVSLCDIIDIEKNNKGTIELIVKNSNLPCNEGNIVYKAAKLFYEKINAIPSCTISLEKHIPVCAGLGGGSSDAAAVLKALNQMYGLVLNNNELSDLALSLGADVPFFINGKTAHAGGIGEVLTPFKLAFDPWLVLIKPDIDISTAEAYREIDSLNTPHLNMDLLIKSAQSGDLKTFAEHSGNSFEYVCKGKYPQIDIIKNHFRENGALFSMMSGSGPTVFGAFSCKEQATKAFETYPFVYQGGAVCNFVKQ